MANTTYISAPCVGLGNKSDENIKWQDGSLVSYSGQLTPDLGSTQLWKNDVTWNITRNSNKFINDDNAYSIGGENGKEHWAIYRVNSDFNGLYPPMELVSGFGIGWYQDSTAGHGMYPKRFGVRAYNPTTGADLIWGCSERSRGSNNSSWQHLIYDFSESDRTALQGFRFDGFYVQISSQSGTGTRSTSVSLGNFRLHYEAGLEASTNRWVVGKYRSRGNSGSQAIQGK